MNRRTVLAGVGIAVVGLAGCADGTMRDPGEETLTDGTAGSTPTDSGPERLAVGDSATITGETSLALRNPTVQASIVAHHSLFLTLQREDGVQFVVVEVDGNPNVDPSSFVLERNGTIQSPPQPQQYVRSIVRECERTCIAIPIDAEAAASAAIAYRPADEVRAVWGLDETTVTTFSDTPALRLQDAAVTDRKGNVGVEFSVDNVGDRDGVFLGLIAPAWMADVQEPVGFTVPRGDTVTETVVPREIQRLDPEEAVISTETTADTRRFEIGSKS